MEKSLPYYPKILLLIWALLAFSCHKEDWYKKQFSDVEKAELSARLLAAESKHYDQGTVADQFILEESIINNPENAATWQEIGGPYLKRGLAKEAMHFYGKAVKLDPVSWQGWRGYLYLYFYRDYVNAIADFDATDILTPDFTDYPQGQSVDYMRGLCYYGLEDYTTALQFFSKYIEEVTLEKEESWVDVYAFLYRGLTFEKLNKPELA